MPKSLITGGAGFIGSNLARYLLEEGHDLVVVDNLSTGRRKNISVLEDDIRFVEGDVRDREQMRHHMMGVDYVFHQAALPSVPRSIDNPWDTNDHNVNGTLSVLMAAHEKEVRRVVCAASSSVYGDTKKLPKVEPMKPVPLSPYAVSKHVGELYAHVFYKVYGLETVVLRYFNVFGPRQRPGSAYAAAIPKFANAYMEGEAPTIYGDGEQTRDFTYVQNVVEANLGAATAGAEKVAGEVFNVGCGGRISVNDLVYEIKAIVGSEVEPVYGETRPGDVRDSQADISKAREAFGYDPSVELREGLRRTVQWLEAQMQPAAGSQ